MTRALMLVLAVFALGAAGAGVWRASAAPTAEPRNPACADDHVAAARAAFKDAYAAGDYQDAAAALEDVWSDCAAVKHGLPDETAGGIVSDLAIADHRAGDDHECLEALEGYWPANRSPTPDFARLSPTLQRAMKFNWGLCQAGCADASLVDAVCQSLENNDDLEKRVLGFTHVACPLRPGASAVALPDGTCVAVLPPRKRFDTDIALGDRRADVCPTAAHLAQVGGKLVTTRLATPATSFLNSPEFCCDPIDLTIDASGRIAAEPHDQWGDGCTTGHPPGAMQDIFQLQGGRLVMVKQLQAPWFPSP